MPEVSAVGVGCGLSQRRLQIVRLVAAGKSNVQIARQLSISPDTVKSTLTRIRELMGAKNRTHLAALAAQAGMLDEEGEAA